MIRFILSLMKIYQTIMIYSPNRTFRSFWFQNTEHNGLYFIDINRIDKIIEIDEYYNGKFYKHSKESYI